MCSDAGDWTLLQPGSPIRKSLDHSSVTSSPRLIAGSYVLHRLLVPRHPPCALTNLTNKDARVHCAVLKLRAVIDPTPAPAPPPPDGRSERYDRESVRTSRPPPPGGRPSR